MASSCWGADFTLSIYPKNMELICSDGQSQPTNTLPDKHRIRVASPVKFVNYRWQWQYSNSGNTWFEFPSGLGFGSKQSIEFSGNDLLSNFEDVIRNNRKINIRLLYPCGEASMALPLTPTYSAPNIAGVETIQETCHQDNNGQYIVKLDRKLKEGETFSLTLNGESLKESTSINKDMMEGEGNIYILKNADNTDGGELGIGITKYNNVIEYTADNQQKKYIVMPARTPVEMKLLTTDSVNCYGGHDGIINLTAQGGTGDYRVKYFRDEISTPDSTDFSPSCSIASLQSALYRIYLYDTNGCKVKDSDGSEKVFSVTISQPENRLFLDQEEAIPPLGFGLTDGTIKVRAIEGTPGYDFIWKKNGEDFDAHTESPPFSAAVGTVGDGLYHIRVQDSRYAAAMKRNPDESNIRGCYDTLSVRIIEPPKLEVKLATLDSILCHGGANGSIVARAAGGVPYDDEDAPYRYEWSELRPYQDDRDTILKELPAGTYTVTVMDGNGITNSFTYMLPQPDVLQAGATGNTILCDGDADGRMEATARGGTTPYRYEWASAYAQIDGNISVMETLSATGVTNVEATCWGKITGQGSNGIKEYGIEMNYYSGPEKIPYTTTKADSFAVQLTGLTMGSQYTYRAYAIENNDNIIYGWTKEFFTLVPTDFSVFATNITGQSADIQFTNTEQLREWGLYYGTNDPATTEDTGIEATGEQVVTLTGLDPYTYYSVLAYATDKNGASSSYNSYFYTDFVQPQLSDPVSSGISISGATISFEVVSFGGTFATVSECGVQYSTDEQTWTKKQTVYAEGTLSYTLTGLTPATKYYIRAYARNNGAKEGYSETVDFTTLGAVPTLAKPAVTGLTSYKINMTGGNVTAENLLSVTEYGFCWSTTQGQAVATGNNYAKVIYNRQQGLSRPKKTLQIFLLRPAIT
jgi:hypothetical protein